MVNNYNILLCIVTRNRSNLLKRCIEEVQKQSLKPDKLLIINNGSTDNTLELLKSYDVEVISQENSGSAGGWHSGIKYALDNNYNFIWLMDDDGFPDRTALQSLVKEIKENINCVSSVLVDENNPNKLVFPMPVLDKKKFPSIFSFKRKIKTTLELRMYYSKEGQYPFIHFFNGALLRIEAVKKIGNINKNYFLYGDELDFFYRISKVGGVYSITNSLHFHPDVNSRKVRDTWIYYYIKNSLIINYKYLNYSFLRSLGVIFLSINRIFLRNSFFSLFNYLLFDKNRLIFRAILNGFKNKIGRDHE